MKIASEGQPAGVSPHSYCRIIQLNAAQETIIKEPRPAATSTLPLGNNVAVSSTRTVPISPVGDHVSVAGSYSSALFKTPALFSPPTTSTLPEGSNVAV